MSERGESRSRRTQVGAALLLSAALLMAFGAFVHATVVVRHLREDMEEIHVRPALLRAVWLALQFGTFSMVGFALVLAAVAVAALRGRRAARLPLTIIAAAYVAFGAAAFLWGGSAHTLGYAVAGALTGVAAAALPGERGRE